MLEINEKDYFVLLSLWKRKIYIIKTKHKGIIPVDGYQIGEKFTLKGYRSINEVSSTLLKIDNHLSENELIKTSEIKIENSDDYVNRWELTDQGLNLLLEYLNPFLTKKITPSQLSILEDLRNGKVEIGYFEEDDEEKEEYYSDKKAVLKNHGDDYVILEEYGCIKLTETADDYIGDIYNVYFEITEIGLSLFNEISTNENIEEVTTNSDVALMKNNVSVSKGPSNDESLRKDDKIKIFISYAREDIEIAKRIYNDLKQLGFQPWLDSEELLPGIKWKPAIRTAIRECSYFMALISNKSNEKRGFVQTELYQAFEVLLEFHEMHIFIIPVRIEPCIPNHEKLLELNWVDLFPSYEEGLSKILKVLKRNSERG